MLEKVETCEIEVVLPRALLTLFPEAPAATRLEAATVGEMIDALDRRWPGMAARLRDERPAVRKHVNVFVDGLRSDLATAIPAGSTVYVLTAISGG